MSPLEITREELAWALSAVIPHVGPYSKELDWVGLEADPYLNDLLVFATDSYTVGIAKAQCDARGGEFSCHLTPKEVRDLLQFVRPAVVAERNQVVQMLVTNVGSVDPDNPSELHVAIPDALEGTVPLPGEKSQPLSGVWSVRVPGNTFRDVYGVIEKVWEHARRSEVFVAPPKALARFSRAERDGEVANWYTSRSGDNTAAVVTVGSGFLGAVAGIAASRHTSTLAGWGLISTELETAA